MTSNETFDSITTYGYAYIIPSICLFGILCNTLNLTILTNKRLKESPYTYLCALATFDLITLLLGLSTTFTRSSTFWFPTKSIDLEYRLTKYERNFFLPSANVFSAVSVIVTVSLTIERYLFIKFPMSAVSYCSPKYARIIVTILFVCVFLFRIPMYLFYDVSLVPIDAQSNLTNISQALNSSSYRVKIQTKYEKFQHYYYLLSFFIFEILPFFVLSILNVSLILIVKNANKESRKMRKLSIISQNIFPDTSTTYNMSTTGGGVPCHSTSNSGNFKGSKRLSPNHPHNSSSGTNTATPNYSTKRDKDQLRLTRTLIAVIFIALFSEISSIITYDKITYFLIGKYYANYMKTVYKIQKLCTLMIILISHSVNFFLYCAFNQKYLAIFRQTYSFLWNSNDFKKKCSCCFRWFIKNKNASQPMLNQNRRNTYFEYFDLM